MHACKSCKKIYSSHNSVRDARDHAKKCKQTSEVFQLLNHKELNMSIDKHHRDLVHQLCTDLSSKALFPFGTSRNPKVCKLLDAWGRLCIKYNTPLQPVDLLLPDKLYQIMLRYKVNVLLNLFVTPWYHFMKKICVILRLISVIIS